MKEHIYTIPVMDAFRIAAEERSCPICAMRRALEADSLSYTLGPSYMEDDTRAQTDKTGFCADHWKKLYACQNRLGLSLIMHTHVKYILGVLNDRQNAAGSPKRGVFSKPADPMGGGLREIAGGCFICSRVGRILDRYIDTMFHMWPDTPELAALADKCGGFCLAHFVAVMALGPEKLKERDWQAFRGAVIPIQRKTLENLEADLDWFIKKFDYRNADEPWGNAKDALPRALKTIGGAEAAD